MSKDGLKGLRAALLGQPGESDVYGRGIFPTRVHAPKKPIYEVVTSIYNVLGAGIGLLLLSPLMIGIAIAVKWSSPGPAFYYGQRVGRNQKLFNILKFRTMKVGSEAKIGQRLVRQDEDHYTSIGRFLRKYRLDELPQLINVIKRDMNVVGPRPLRPIFLDKHLANIPGYDRRFLVRPGITGQAQVRGGYYTSPRHKLFYEILYISRRTVALDLQLVVLTFARVMTRIFTTTLLLSWLLVMVLVAPPEFTSAMTLSFGALTFNILYLVPTLIILSHLGQRRMEARRVVAMRTPTDFPIVLFLLWTLLIVPFSIEPVAALRGFGWWLCNGFVVYYLVLNSRMVTDRRGTLIGVLVAGTVAIGLFDLCSILYIWADTGQFNRVQGPMVNPLFMSVLVVLALPLATVRALGTTQGDARNRMIYTASAITLAIVGTLTMSRVGIVAMVIGLSIALWPNARRLLAVCVLILMSVLTAFQLSGDERLEPETLISDSQRVFTRQGRVLSALETERLLPDTAVVTGMGARVLGRTAQSDAYRNHKPTLRCDNMYLTILVEEGVVGLLLFLLIIFRALAYQIRMMPLIKDSGASQDLRAAGGSILACLVLLIVSDALFQLPLVLAFFAALGLSMGLATHYGPDHKRVYRIIQYRDKL